MTITRTDERALDLARWQEELFRLVQSKKTLDEFRVSVLTALRGEVGGDSAMYVPGPPIGSVDGRSLRVLKPIMLDHPAEGMAKFLSGPQPFREALSPMDAAQRKGVPFVDREAFPSEDRHQTKAYRELFEFDGVGSFLVMPLSFMGAQIGCYIISRKLGGAVYQPDEAVRVRPLLSMLVMADRLKAHEARSPTALAGPDLAASGLTQRERQIAELAASGLQNKAIAESLGLSPNTVRNVLAQVFEKLQVQTRTQLAYKLLEAQQPGTPPQG